MAGKSIIRGRFSKSVDMDAMRFSSSHRVDRKLYEYDIKGSIAHAEMLAAKKIISGKDLAKIHQGMKTVKQELDSASFEFNDSLEDIHMHIESRLIELTGDAGKKLHTGRSRNDQVVLDFIMYCKEESSTLISLLKSLQMMLLKKAKDHKDVFMPAYTHLQQAMVIRAAHHFLAYVNMFDRDIKRLEFVLDSLSESPLGCGALAGTGLGNDRLMVARKLGFKGVTGNSLDTVANRDFALEMLFNISIISVHLSRFCEEIIIWFSREFDYINLGEAFCTGSSLMPQKFNPDMAELIRGKTGRFIGNLVNLLVTMKALPLSYNRDLQEDKESVFDSVESVKLCLKVFTGMISSLSIKKDILKAQKDDYMLATDVAEYLVNKGLPFREAHEATGKLVRYAVDKNKWLKDLSISDFKNISSYFDQDIYKILKLEKSPDSKNTIGAPSLKDVKRQIAKWEKKLKS